MKTHICKVCGATSDDVKFYSGVNSRCSECHKSAVRENRAANLEYYREYDAKRFKEDPRVLDRIKKYQLTEAGIASSTKAKKKWIETNPYKRSAHNILNNAIRDGKIEKPKTCNACGAGGRIHGHHHDYTRPLDVKWLCPRCHTEEHRNMQ